MSVNRPPTGVPWRKRSPLKQRTVHLASGSRFSSADSQHKSASARGRFREHLSCTTSRVVHDQTKGGTGRNWKSMEKCAPTSFTSCYYWLRISRSLFRSEGLMNSSVCVAPIRYPVTPLTKIYPSLPEQSSMLLSLKHFR